MNVKNWLLAGTSLTMLALSPISATKAQDAGDPALVSAYAAFQADQSAANRDALTQACIAAGYQSLDDCIAALSGQTPVEQASSDASPASDTASSEAAPAEASSSEATPVEASSSEVAAPAETSSSEAAPVEPSSSEAAPVEAPSSEAAPVTTSSSEPMTATSSAAPTEASSAPADTTSSVAPTATDTSASAGAGSDAVTQLTAAVDAYNAAVAKVDAGDTGARAEAEAARAQVDAICTTAGFTDTQACVTQFGLTLNPLPAGTASDATSSAPADTTSSAAAPADASSVPPVSELPQASETVDPSAVEVLPSDVASEAAPILDSAKDQQNASSAPAGQQNASSAPASQQPSEASQPASSASSAASEAPPAPASQQPPQTDADAQAAIQPPADQQAPITEQGQRKRPDFVFTPPPPSGVQVVEKPRQDNGGIVFRLGVNIYINNPQQARDRIYNRDRGDQIFYEDLSRGRTRETIERADGTKVITVYDRYGDVEQRTKVLRDGRVIILASYNPNDDEDQGNWRDPGDQLPPLVLNIPASQYILDADSADEDQVQSFLSQPPVEQVQRIYTIDEVKRSARLRDSVRRLEIGDLTFDTGKATISRDQVGSLATVAKAMQQLLAKSPGEVFLIEGHTDAVGSDVSNLVLSDERAATVARILTDFYEIPPENLVTQGYGERYLKVKTEDAERLNRRVTIKRITPLVAYENGNSNNG